MSFHKKLQAINKLKYFDSIVDNMCKSNNNKSTIKISNFVKLNETNNKTDFSFKNLKNIFVINKKRGRKTLKFLGFNDEQIMLRRKNQNKFAARKSRIKKKTETTIDISKHKNNNENRIISQSQYYMLQLIIEKCIENTLEINIKSQLQHTLKLLDRLPLM